MADDVHPAIEPYQVIQPPKPPALGGSVVVRNSVDEILDAVAADLLIQAVNCVRAFGDFHLALSGGSTPLPLYQRLMIDPRYRELPWSRTHLWIVDERRVPFDDAKSNFRAIDEIIGQHSGIPREQVHPMLAMSPTADADYERALRQALFFREKGQDRLDFVLLGMGNDGHTASLFPHSPALQAGHETLAHDDARPRLVRINDGPAVTPPDRVTMTFPLLNAARFIAVLVTGAGKKPMLSRIAAARAGKDTATPPTPTDLPILGIKPVAGELRWYLDADACPTPA
ncbi:MAG: 6-phosphogluconolactonase [Planctomycetaceae bacterium]|jgi:6-phosphogluconolactonase|nr:6-phosphogluconolactonase [Planctomycetaceae bacterium]